MTGIHRRSPSFLARVVFPDPGWPVMMMHFGFLLMFLDAQRWPSAADARSSIQASKEQDYLETCYRAVSCTALLHEFLSCWVPAALFGVYPSLPRATYSIVILSKLSIESPPSTPFVNCF